MRFSIIFLASALAITGCKQNDAGQTGVDAAGSGSAAFTIQSTDTVIPAGTEVTYCYYFHTPNTANIAVNRWVSDMTPGSHHMIFFTGGPDHPDGLDMSNDCGIGGSITSISKWVFASQTQHLDQPLPVDDGTGKPLAQIIAPNTLGAFQMHYLNSTEGPLTVHVKLSAYAMAANTPYTETDAYVTYNQDIAIPPGSTGTDATGTCPTPAGAKFWTMSTHSHKQSLETKVTDGTAMVVDSTDWEHPSVTNWNTGSFFTYASNSVTWTCHYKNDGETALPDNSAKTIYAGAHATTDEMCMATGYFFPATGPKFYVQYNGSCIAVN